MRRLQPAEWFEIPSNRYKSSRPTHASRHLHEGGHVGAECREKVRARDELGVPFGVTVDFDTVEDDTVTLRERDSMTQRRVPIAALPQLLRELCGLDGDVVAWKDALSAYAEVGSSEASGPITLETTRRAAPSRGRAAAGEEVSTRGLTYSSSCIVPHEFIARCHTSASRQATRSSSDGGPKFFPHSGQLLVVVEPAPAISILRILSVSRRTVRRSCSPNLSSPLRPRLEHLEALDAHIGRRRRRAPRRNGDEEIHRRVATVRTQVNRHRSPPAPPLRGEGNKSYLYIIR